MRITKIIKINIILFLTTLTLTSCGNKEDKTIKDTDTEITSIVSDASSTDSTFDAIGDIEADENVFSVTLTIPKDIIGEVTQEELDESTKSKGYKSATLNGDGSVTYIMTKKQHRELLDSIAAEIDKGLKDLEEAEELPDITSITTNENYSYFTVTTKNTEISLAESYTVPTFYTFGGMYSAFSGEDIDNIHIDFINEDSGEVINTADSKDLISTDSN